MLIMDIEREIKPLSKTEKLQLIQDVVEMLKDDEQDDRDRYFIKSGTYELSTPPGTGNAAQQLDTFLKRQSV